MRKYLAALLATALALPPLSALADVKPPPSMLTNASNAVLPAARTSLGVPTNWLLQYHQNGGGTVNGHNLGWGDQNYDVIADHMGAQSQDASQTTTATLGGSLTTGDQIGWQIGAAHSYITVAAGDTSTIVLQKLGAALQGGAVGATVAAGATGGYTNGDIVSLTGTTLNADCPAAPQFQLTVAGGSVTAAAVTGSVNSGIIGGYCPTTPTGPFAVTGGHGSGLTLNVSFASPAVAQAMLAVADANGIGHAATAHVAATTLLFDFPYGTTLLTCASGGTGSGCPGSPTETIAVSTFALDNGPYGYLARLVPGRAPQVNDAIAAWRGDGQSSAVSGLNTAYGGLEVWIGAVGASPPSSSSPEGTVSLEGSGDGNVSMSPLLSCQYSYGCWVESGTGSTPNRALSAGSPGSFGIGGFLMQNTTISGETGTLTTTANNGYYYIGGGQNQILLGALGASAFLSENAGNPIAVTQHGGAPGILTMGADEFLDSGANLKASFGWAGSYTHLYDNVGGYDAIKLMPGGALSLMPGGQQGVVVGGTLAAGATTLSSSVQTVLQVTSTGNATPIIQLTGSDGGNALYGEQSNGFYLYGGSQGLLYTSGAISAYTGGGAVIGSTGSLPAAEGAGTLDVLNDYYKNGVSITATEVAGQKALQATKTSNYAVLAGDSNTSFDNTGASGAVTFTLPTYAAGLKYCFTVTAAQTLEVLAPASNKIAIGTSNSASAGNIQASAVYSTVCVVATRVNDQWAATSTTGSWTVN